MKKTFFFAIPIMIFYCGNVFAQTTIDNPIFGTIHTVDFNGNNDFLYAMSVDADGHILLAGSTGYPGEIAIAKLNADYSPDQSFGKNGKATIAQSKFYIRAMAVLPDGKIILAGSQYNDKNQNAVLLKLHENGTPDPAFGNNGWIISDFPLLKSTGENRTPGNDKWNSVAVQEDGKIIAAGVSEEITSNGNYRFAILSKFLPDGSPDKSFGENGHLKLRYVLIGEYDWEINTVCLQKDRKILAGGNVKPGGYDAALVRFNENGTIDSSFGLHGYSVGYEDYFFSSMILDNDQNIYACGRWFNGKYSDFRIVKYKSDGYLDRSFGKINKNDQGGSITTAIQKKSDDDVQSLIIRNDGRITALGCSQNMLAISTYQANGSPDLTFGNEGKMIAAIDNSPGTACEYDNIVLHPNGKILIAGHIYINEKYDFFIIEL